MGWEKRMEEIRNMVETKIPGLNRIYPQYLDPID